MDEETKRELEKLLALSEKVLIKVTCEAELTKESRESLQSFIYTATSKLIELESRVVVLERLIRGYGYGYDT